MTRTDCTDITVVLDRSGSMASISEQTIAGFNQFLADQRQQPGTASISLIQFDDQYEPVYSGIPLAEAVNLTPETFVPRGSTALLDAIGRAIDDTGRRLAALPESQRPGHVLIVIITDGLENSSRHYSHQQVSDLISHQRDVYQWHFVFLAANQDAIATAAALHMDRNSALTYSATGKAADKAWRSLSRATVRFRTVRARSSSNDFAFTDDERKESGGEDSA